MKEVVTRQAETGTAEDRVIEEVGELLQAIGKAHRFGLYNAHPDRPQRTNYEEILLEAEDVILAVTRYTRFLHTLQPMPEPGAA